MLCSYANKMEENALKTITSLEQELGKTLLAFQCNDLKPTGLSESELAKLQEAEKELGVSLVAIES